MFRNDPNRQYRVAGWYVGLLLAALIAHVVPRLFG